MIADLNRDGNLDLAAPALGGGSQPMSIALGNGDGTFTTSPGPLTNSPRNIDAADFDGDRDPDLAVAGSGGGLSILVGDGTGAFTPGPVLAGVSFPGGLAAADLDTDGDPDLALVHTGNDRVHTYLGDGAGAFVVDGTFSVGDFPRDLDPADLNRDGIQDLAIANNGEDPATAVSTLIARGAATMHSPVLRASFGRLRTGGAGVAQTLPIRNGGNGALEIVRVQLGGSGSASFQIQREECTVERIGAEGECEVDVRFTPGTPGFKRAFLRVDSNSSDSPLLIPLSGFADGGAPESVIATGPNGLTNDSTPTYTFTAPETGATFECQVAQTEWRACTSPYTTPQLSDGDHTFKLRATDPEGNADPTPAFRDLIVDATAPETKIDSGPGATTQSTTPMFNFSASEGGASFQCSVDGGAFSACSSPFTTATLSEGNHTFAVRATDQAQNTDPVPETRSFAVASVVCQGLPATIVGTNADDDIYGTPGADVIVGGGGDDRIRGAGGSDRVCGKSGDDEITDDVGAQIVSGGGGDDEVQTGSGVDILRGSGGDDLLDGGNQNDTITGSGGDDTLRGGPQSDTVRGGGDDDDVDGGDGTDTCAGGSGENVLTGCP